MGHANSEVEILHWKAAWEQDRERGRTDTDRYPRMASDLRSPMLDLSAAVAAGNPISQTTRPAAVEVLEAAGQGTLTTRPRAAQTAAGSGVYADGSWVVTFVRELSSPMAQLTPGAQASVAFAVWQGSMRDRNGQKNVSIWHDLVLEK
jgi:DMSO reductase family type II enzyme heme b subunit